MIKLITNEVLFAELDEVSGDNITVKNPFVVERKFTKDPDGLKSNIMYEPWCDYGESEYVTINRSSIIVCEPLHPKLSKLYDNMIEEITNVAINNTLDGEQSSDKGFKLTLH